MTQPTPQFYLIDAHGFLHRNYHALPKLSTSTGLEVGALYGFLRWILKMLKTKHPPYVAVCFDSPGGCVRLRLICLSKVMLAAVSSTNIGLFINPPVLEPGDLL